MEHCLLGKEGKPEIRAERRRAVKAVKMESGLKYRMPNMHWGTLFQFLYGEGCNEIFIAGRIVHFTFLEMQKGIRESRDAVNNEEEKLLFPSAQILHFGRLISVLSFVTGSSKDFSAHRPGMMAN